MVLDKGYLQAVPIERYLPEGARRLPGLSNVVRVSLLNFSNFFLPELCNSHRRPGEVTESVTVTPVNLGPHRGRCCQSVSSERGCLL